MRWTKCIQRWACPLMDEKKGWKVMMRFVMADGLPYLLHNGKTYAVRWDENGFTVGTEVKLASVPAVSYPELSLRAKFPRALDSIGKQERQEVQPEQEEVPFQEEPVRIDRLEEMTLNQLKATAESVGIRLGNARKKAEIIKAIKNVIADD